MHDQDDIRRLYDRIADIKATNAALVEALEALADDVQGVTNGDCLTRIEACRNARAAIAKAKGE